VLACTLGFTILYGLYRSRGSDTVDHYLLAGKSMPWYAMGLSIMATQASAITVSSQRRLAAARPGLPTALAVGKPEVIITVATLRRYLSNTAH